MPPRICPPPPDCPLYSQRLDYGADEPLRRAVLAERRPGSRLANLVLAEAQAVRLPIAALPASSEPEPMPIFSRRDQKGVPNE